MVEDTAKERKRLTLVQAVSLFRQKKKDEVVRTVNNLVSQHRAFPAPVSWDRKEEVMDLFMTYASQTEDRARQDEVAAALSLSADEADKLRDVVANGGFQSAQQEVPQAGTSNDLSYFG